MTKPPPRLWAAVVTYRRPGELSDMLAAVAAQTMPVHRLLVIDNGSEPAVAAAAAAHGADYRDAGDNLGPAGGVALAMRTILAEADDQDWLLLLDDDDPPHTESAVAELWAFAQDCLRDDPRTGGVGHTGGFYRRTLGIWRRPEDAELVGRVAVDVIGGGHLPIYRCAAIREAGIFDQGLFFGFEEGEYGMRMRSKGFALYVDGPAMLAYRRATGTDAIPSAQVRTRRDTAAWRRYYGVRNATIVAGRYGAPWTPLLVAGGGAYRGVRALALSRRPISEIALPVRGAVAGLLRRTGRTINPARSTK